MMCKRSDVVSWCEVDILRKPFLCIVFHLAACGEIDPFRYFP